MKIKTFVIGFLLLLLYSLPSCGRNHTNPLVTPTVVPPKLEKQKPSLRGEIKNIYKSNNIINGFYAEGEPQSETDYQKARVIVTNETKIYTKNGDSYLKADRNELKVGITVEVLFDGSVEESDPVRAVAGEILILK